MGTVILGVLLLIWLAVVIYIFVKFWNEVSDGRPAVDITLKVICLLWPVALLAGLLLYAYIWSSLIREEWQQ